MGPTLEIWLGTEIQTPTGLFSVGSVDSAPARSLLFFVVDSVVVDSVDSAPARSLLFFVVDSVCLFVTLLQKLILLLCFSMESSHFLAISSP